MRFGLIVAATISLMLSMIGASAEDIKVLSAGVMKEVIVALIPEFEKRTGTKVVLDVAPAGTLAKRIEENEAFDVAVITRPGIDSLIEKGKIKPDSKNDLAGVGIGVAVKEGAPRPDISTVESFKRSVLAAKSVAHTDPAAGATSGIYLVKLFDKLGIGDQVKQKVTLVPGGSSAALVAKGEVELAIQQASEILHVPGTTYVGPLPADIQNITTYSAAIGVASRNVSMARSFIDLLKGPEAGQLLSPHGLEPAKPVTQK